MTTRRVIISDPTLRDGNHAVGHTLTVSQIIGYAVAADQAGIDIVEVGHGNGLGASSMLVGQSVVSDRAILENARRHLTRSKLGIHVIPGFATINKDLRQAIEIGVDVVRVASHCTEADTTQRHIGFVREMGREAYGVLMMSHMTDDQTLLAEARKLESYGAQAVIIMDSAGAYLPHEVTQRISTLVDGLGVPVGFHGHNNLGMAIANTIAAYHAGASILDGTARGFGAGAGNTQLEALVAVLMKLGIHTNVDLYKILDAADLAQNSLMNSPVVVSSVSIVSGMSGVFSGFAKPVTRIADKYGVDPRDVFRELGRQNAVAGQEDLILSIAILLASQKADIDPID